MRPENVTSVTISSSAGPGDPEDSGGPRLTPGDLVELQAGEAAHGGSCVARLDGIAGAAGTGPVVFVRHTLPGERVRARITEVTARFARADAVDILDPAPGRVEPPCPYARPGGCGGCDWQHAALPLQRQLKASVVGQQLRRIAGIDWPVTVEALPGDGGGPGDGEGAGDGESAGDGRAAPGLGWRTRVRFAVSRDGAAGLRAHRSHEVIEIADCLIAHPGIRDLGVPQQSWAGATSVETVVSTENGERAEIVSGQVRPAAWKQATAESVLAVTSRGGPGPRPRGSSSRDRGSRDRGSRDRGSRDRGSRDRGARGGPGGNRTVRGHSHLLQHGAERAWRVSATGFWQVHPAAADTLAQAVLDALRPQPGDTALDLYCGAGLFTGVLAEAVGRDGTVVGVESGSAAVRDARRNLRQTPWASVYQGDAGEVIASRGLPLARLAVLDPPRAGAARDVIEYLARPVRVPAPSGSDGAAGERRIAYVSCDPATLARDIAIFAAHGWYLENLRAFDAFPMTHHVECLATLVAGQ
jgi:tRNA/tmRNA/rRNA uracil-C5-methylase (TrmA/RlmC/RlmD family)